MNASVPALAVSLAISVFSSVAGAEPDISTPVDQVIVTATRIEQPVASVAVAVTVLSADEVRASQKTALSDLLKTTPGVSVARNGGLGATTTLSIRGAESEQTAVLIDGVKLNDPSSPGGGYNFANLLTNDFARIEVLRGPQSTLWGSQAIGGVVNIVTEPPQGPLAVHVSAEGGSRKTMEVAARAEAAGERSWWRVGGNYLTTDGVSAFDDDLGGREDDGFSSVGWNARGVLAISDAISIDLRGNWSKGRNNFDGFPPPSGALADTREYGDSEEFVGYGGLNVAAFNERLHNRLGFAYTETDRDNFDPASRVPRTFDAAGTNKRFEYQGSFAFTDTIQSVFGVESERSELRTASPTVANPSPVPLNHSVRIDSVYAQAQVSPISSLTMSAGVRHDDHDTFNGNSTTQAGVAWSATTSTVLRANYGEGFKAPTLFQLFSEFGNATLDPEESEGWDAGVEQKLLNDAITLSAVYFERDTDNMIAFVSCFGQTSAPCRAQPGGYYDNTQKTTADGIELGASVKIGERLSVNGNYTTMHVENDVRGAANFGRSLPRRPRETASLEVGYRWPIGLQTTIAAQRVGRSYDDAANRFPLDAYTLVDLRASYAVSDKLEVYGRVENLLDEDYSTIRRYGSLGRGAFIGARQTF